MTDQLGQIGDKYEVVEKLGEGGMGAIYKVRHLLLDEMRVVKVMRQQIAEDERQRARFMREAKAAIRLRHPNIAQLYDFSFDADGSAYIVMEYIDGRNMKEVLEADGPQPVDLVLDLGIQGLKAIGYLHRQGFIHRDISPDNLMLTRDTDDQPLVKLIDLGLAKPVAAEVTITEAGTFVGKVAYASPEQFGGPKGGASIDPRADLYSFGAVLYQLLTGRLPIPGKDYQSMIAGHLFHPPVAFDRSDPGGVVPLPLRKAIMRSLAKEPGDRFPDAKAFRTVLERCSGVASGEISGDLLIEAMTRKTEVITPSAAMSDVTSVDADVRPTVAISGEAKEAGRNREAIRTRRFRVAAAVAMIAFVILVLVFTRFSTDTNDGAGRLPEGSPAVSETAESRVIVEAAPWAQVVSLVDRAGNGWLHGTHDTPLLLELPVGHYVSTVRNPRTGEMRVLEMEVKTKRTSRYLVRFAPIDLPALVERVKGR